MSVEKAFSRSSESYTQTNFIQKDVANRLIKIVRKDMPKNIIDIGAGVGTVYSTIDWKLESFLAIDFSQDMLELHPSNREVVKKNGDFDLDEFWNGVEFSKFDAIISSSALQWSKNLKLILQKVSKIDKPLYFAIFTDRTFNEIHRELGIKSPIYSKKYILESLSLYNYEVVDYKLKFPSRLEALQYIKNSGVSGGNRVASIKKLKKFIEKSGEFQLSLQVMILWRV